MLIKYVKNTSGSGANTMFSRNQFSLWNKTLLKISFKSNPFVSVRVSLQTPTTSAR